METTLKPWDPEFVRLTYKLGKIGAWGLVAGTKKNLDEEGKEVDYPDGDDPLKLAGRQHGYFDEWVKNSMVEPMTEFGHWDFVTLHNPMGHPSGKAMAFDQFKLAQDLGYDRWANPASIAEGVAALKPWGPVVFYLGDIGLGEDEKYTREYVDDVIGPFIDAGVDEIVMDSSAKDPVGHPSQRVFEYLESKFDAIGIEAWTARNSWAASKPGVVNWVVGEVREVDSNDDGYALGGVAYRLDPKFFRDSAVWALPRDQMLGAQTVLMNRLPRMDQEKLAQSLGWMWAHLARTQAGGLPRNLAFSPWAVGSNRADVIVEEVLNHAVGYLQKWNTTTNS